MLRAMSPGFVSRSLVFFALLLPASASAQSLRVDASAEASGIKALQEFSMRLRSYA